MPTTSPTGALPLPSVPPDVELARAAAAEVSVGSVLVVASGRTSPAMPVVEVDTSFGAPAVSVVGLDARCEPAPGAAGDDGLPPGAGGAVPAGATTGGAVDGGTGRQSAGSAALARGGGSEGFPAPAGWKRQPSTTSASTRHAAGPKFEYCHCPSTPCQYDQYA
jgi:hypothetical protein